MAIFELYTYKSNGGILPTIAPECLVIQAYLNLIEVEWVSRTCSIGDLKDNGNLPILRYGRVYISGVDEIIVHLNRMVSMQRYP